MPVNPQGEAYAALQALIAQLADNDVPALSRVTATISVAPYLEAITRTLVDDALADGASWDDLGQAFGTSEMNVRARFGSYRTYDDDDEAED